MSAPLYFLLIGNAKRNKKSKKVKNGSNPSGAEGGRGVVGYQIRFDSSTVTSDTKVKFMTDGILLKEVIN